MKEFWTKNRFLIGGIWGVSTTFLSIYWTIYPLEQNARLTYYMKSKVDVFSIDQPINELRIILNGKDIRKKNLNLRVFKYQVINDGQKDIQTGSYVDEVPFGIKVQGGQIARINVTRGNSTINKHNLIKKLSLDSTVANFNHLFWGEDEAIVFDVWIVHQKKVEPKIIPIGRIADTKISESLDNIEKEEERDSDWLMVRLIYSLLFSGVALVVFVGIFVGVVTRVTIHRRNRRIIKAYDLDYNRSDKSQKILIKFNRTVEHAEFIKALKQIADIEKFTNQFQKKKEMEQLHDQLVKLIRANNSPTFNKHSTIKPIQFLNPVWKLLDMLFAAELAKSNDEGVQIKPEFIDQVNLTLKAFGK